MRLAPPPHRPRPGNAGPRREPVKPLAPEPRRPPTAQELAPPTPPFPRMMRCTAPACTRPWTPPYYHLDRWGLCFDCALVAGVVSDGRRPRFDDEPAPAPVTRPPARCGR